MSDIFYYTVSHGQALMKLRKGMTASQTDLSVSVWSQEPYVAKGAAMIPNSVIRDWSDNVGAEEAVGAADAAVSISLKPTSKLAHSAPMRPRVQALQP
ncbi:MAG: hypothetical protein KBD82_05775 [Rhodoferax sp.]|uniref:hypothetical protein n=1 Tax=Rhodoferax sp. TaxID=50421 RepID=UPI001B717A40|nr:hypothetical protein [Rhodoferax sp.]MBP9735131.1 hypothetical protein [Rhodoferax sp.]